MFKIYVQAQDLAIMLFMLVCAIIIISGIVCFDLSEVCFIILHVQFFGSKIHTIEKLLLQEHEKGLKFFLFITDYNLIISHRQLQAMTIFQPKALQIPFHPKTFYPHFANRETKLLF